MADGSRNITYKPLGLTLGLGSRTRSAPSATAAKSLLDTLLSSVPSAKALLPTIVPELSRSKSSAEASIATGQREGLSSVDAKEPHQTPAATLQNADTGPTAPDNCQKDGGALQPAQTAGAPPPREQQPAANSRIERTGDVIDLLSDSDDEIQAVNLVTSAQGAGPAAAKAEESEATGATAAPKQPSADYIPVPKAASNQAAAAKAAAPGSADALADEEEIRRLGKRPYWMSYVASIDSPLLRLHQELVELCELVQPTPEEAEARRDAVAAVTEVVRSIWPNARCEIFGSYATGLYVPTSDIDLVIMDSGVSNIQSGLKALATALSQRKVAQSIQVIGKARVPIVKFETVDYGNLAFDVSFDVANGPQAALLVTEMTAAWPMMRPLILCLKLFLQQRELNEVYTGGIGSYALITMVAAFLQIHASRRSPTGNADAAAAGGGGGGAEASGKRDRGGGKAAAVPPAPPLHGTAGAAANAFLSGAVEPGLGTLLADFFRFYGRVMNVPEVGVSCANGGQFFRKTDKETPTTGPRGFNGWLNPDRAYLLSVEDPKDPDNDVCRNSFNIMRVKTAFEYAYQMLTAPSQRHESLLARILRLGPILASRPRPRVAHLRELGYYIEPPARQEEMRQERREQRNERKRQKREAEAAEEQQGHAGEDGQQTPGRGRTGKKGDKAARLESRDGGGGKKRARESERGAGESDAKRARGGGGEERKAGPRESTPGQRGASDGGGGGGEGRAQKRRREEATSPAVGGGRGSNAGAARADDTSPSRGSKRARRDTPGGGRSQQRLQAQTKWPGGLLRQQSGGLQGSDWQGHGQQQGHRRPALMHVTAVPPPAPVPVVPPLSTAPIFHPGYIPAPLDNSRHRHHSHHHHHHHHHSGSDSRHHQGDRQKGYQSGGGGGGRSQHQHQPDDRYDNRASGGYGGGGDGGGQRQRAPVVAPQRYAPPPQQPQQPQVRGRTHNHNGQRTHVFFD